MGTFVIKPSNGQFMFNLRAGNGEIILTSERYTSRVACVNGINAVKENAPHDDRYTRLTASSGQYYFTLKARNGEIIGTSEMYQSTAGRDAGIESVKREAPNAGTIDG